MHPRPSLVPPLRRALVLLAALLAGSTAAVVLLVRDGPLSGVPVAYGFPATGALYAATGLLAWWRRPGNRLGALLVWAGALWLVASLANTAVPLLIAAGTVAAVLPVSVLLHLLHASPGGQVRGALSRSTVVAGYATGLVLQAPLWAFVAQPPPYDLLAVADRPDLAQAGYRVQQVVGTVVVALTVLVLLRRLREQQPAQRRLLAPLFLYGVVAVVAAPLVANVLMPLLDLGPEPTAALQLALVGTVPLGLLAVVLRGGFARTAELDAFVTSIASSSDAERDLDDAVAATLGDPSARLLRWSDGTGGYVGADGRPVELPGPGAGQDAVQVEVGGQRLGAVLYDPQLGTDPAAVAAVGRVAAIALDRERLLREAADSRRALQEASTRLLDDTDLGRRQLARDLHDGLQGALVRLGVQAHRLAQEQPGPGTAELAARHAADVDAAAATLRAVVDGVLPPPLVERGLAAAVQELAYDLPVRAALEVHDVPARLPPTVETTAYFIVAEALTNVVKHAGARTVGLSLRVAEEVLTIDVRDDGRGGVRGVSGTGLRSLRDRVDVLGGSLVVESDDDGTRLRAALPCA